MMIEGGTGWREMKKCENYMFCKPRGITLHGQFSLRVISDTGSIDVTVSIYLIAGGKEGGAYKQINKHSH